MFIATLRHTPVWVWGLLTASIVLGLWQTRDREMSLARITVLPMVLLGMSLVGVLGAFGPSPIALGSWAIGVGTALVIGRRVIVVRGAVWSLPTGTLHVPGSWLPLVLIVGLFAVKYATGAAREFAPTHSMLTMPALPAVLTPPIARKRFLMRGLCSVGFGIVIALTMSGALGTPLWSNLIHSVCISSLCWLAIDSLRLGLARWVHRNDPPGSNPAAASWPGWPLMAVAVMAGSVFGFGIGQELANLILGRSGQFLGGGYFRGSWRQTLALLLGSLVPGMAITYWFYARETIGAKEAAVQAAERQAAEHRLRLLEAQLEPHMLFNTLANLRVLIGVDPQRAQAMLDQLIAFLRATLIGSRTVQQPLRAEFARLDAYLALMRVRMGDRLETHFELPEALAEMPVPPLLLQPLVENCIQHGLEPNVDGGRIDMGAARDGDMLVLTVRDTGAGLSNHAVDGTGFGVVQVRERLATLYGARASLTLAGTGDAEGGTLATIRLPVDAAASP